jgi:acyl-CoA hydrolase
MVIAQVNPKMPRTHGDGFIHLSAIDSFVQVEDDLFDYPQKVLTPTDEAIGRNVAELVQDRATLQVGIGNHTCSVFKFLQDRKGLGIHSEMITDDLLELVELGVLTGAHKKHLPYKITCSFALGTRKLYDFADNSPLFEFRDVAWTNNPKIIRQNLKVTAINGAIEIDLTGQVCADSVGGRIYSGVGGQMDFLRFVLFAFFFNFISLSLY